MKMVASTRTAKERNGWMMDDSGSRFNDGSSAGDDKEEGVENGSKAFLLGWLVGSRWYQGACWNTGNTVLRNTGNTALWNQGACWNTENTALRNTGIVLEYREHSIAEYRERAEEPLCCLGVERLFHPGGKCVVSF